MPSASRWLLLLCFAIVSALMAASSPPAWAQRKKAAPKKPVKINLPASVRQKTKVDMQVTAVNPGSRERIARASSRLDGHVESKLITENQVPNDIASDETFLRRVYLDVARSGGEGAG